MSDDRDAYIRQVLALYVSLPDTPDQPRRADHDIAGHLYTGHVGADTIEAALLLATARRCRRPPEAPRLAPVRSLAYYLPAIEEILANPLPRGYLEYLRSKISARRTSP